MLYISSTGRRRRPPVLSSTRSQVRGKLDHVRLLYQVAGSLDRLNDAFLDEAIEALEEGL